MTKEIRTLETVAQDITKAIINGDVEGVAKLLSEIGVYKLNQLLYNNKCSKQLQPI